LLKPSEYRHMGGGVWPNRHITLTVAKKAKFTVYFVLFTVYVRGRGWLKTSCGGRGFAKNVRISSYRGRRSKIAQKNII